MRWRRRSGPVDGAALHEVGDDGQVGAGLDGAFVDRTHALTDFQADVPQQRQKTLDGVAENFVIGAVEQDQQIDIGIRVQLTATITADRDQRDVGVFTPVELLPSLLQDVVDEPGPVFDQPANVAALAKTRVEHLASLADRLLERRDRTRFEGQFSLELAAVEEFGIHLRHRLAFLL
jgi:hypothetical protein